jgi:nitrate/TMAO reductase-like tetraheme cytochrome c subunit
MTGLRQVPMSVRSAYFVAALVGVLVGLGAYTFRYAEGLSYFSTDPRACVNCHIMRDPYDSWQKASHHATATCVECHLPTAFVAKYLARPRTACGIRRGSRSRTSTSRSGSSPGTARSSRRTASGATPSS